MNTKETNKKNPHDTVITNMGEMPMNDYLDIRAMQYGFDDYVDMRNQGFIFSEN